MQFSLMPQQILQMQVALPKPLGMQLCNGAKRLAQHALLRIGQHGLPRHLAPRLFQAFGSGQVVEQQPTTLTLRQTFGK